MSWSVSVCRCVSICVPLCLVSSLVKLSIRWLRLVGSLKLYISFAEHNFFYRALLQKRPVILRSLLIATLYWDTQECVYAFICLCVGVWAGHVVFWELCMSVCVCYRKWVGVSECVCVCVCVCVCEREREREKKSVRIVCRSVNMGQGRMYRVAKTHRMPYLSRTISAKEPYS